MQNREMAGAKFIILLKQDNIYIVCTVIQKNNLFASKMQCEGLKHTPQANLLSDAETRK